VSVEEPGRRGWPTPPEIGGFADESYRYRTSNTVAFAAGLVSGVLVNAGGHDLVVDHDADGVVTGSFTIVMGPERLLVTVETVPS
jgi:hypothetical protein